MDSVRHYRTERVRLETEPELAVNIDGEVVARTPQDFSVAHNALKVLVPPESGAARRDLLRLERFAESTSYRGRGS